MTAITLGACASTLLPATARLAQSSTPTRKPLAFVHSRTGWITYQQGTPVAWIVPGYHQGQINKQPHTCTFVEVAYHRQTKHGINLETADFNSVNEAKAFIRQVFGQGGAA